MSERPRAGLVVGCYTPPWPAAARRPSRSPWVRRLAVSLGVFAAAVPGAAGASRAATLPAGLPGDAPPAATARQPVLAEPSRTAWPFPDTFPQTSGTGRLAGGALLWSSFVYDDHGAALTAALPASEAANSSSLAPYHGAYVYANPAAENDGADIFRAGVGLDRNYSYWRVDWNTLTDPSIPIAEWTFDTDENPATGASQWPAGAGVNSPGIEEALLVSSHGAWLINAVTGARTNVLSHGGAVTIDRAARSFVVRIPESLLPTRGAWRIRLAAGEANATGDGFRTPTLADGSAAAGMADVYDVAFRASAQEPPIFTGTSTGLGAGVGSVIASLPAPLASLGLDGVSRALTGNFWMEDAQSDALAARDVTAFSTSVVWSQLAAKRHSPEPVPTGYSVRWCVTRFNLGGGLATNQTQGPAQNQNGVYNNIPALRGQVQPYAVYVPTDYTPSHPASLTFLLHALSANYNEYGGLDPQLIQQLCEQRYSICVMPEGLGPGLDWQGKGQADLWQVWRAVADAYAINPNRTVVAGYSMGGSGTNIMATEYPDDFAGALILDGPEDFWPFANARWVPFVMDESVADELAPQYVALEEADRIAALGQRYELRLHVGGDHLLWAIEDRFGDAVQALGEPERVLNPGSFTYTWSPSPSDVADGVGTTADYWITSLTAGSLSRTETLTADDQAIRQPRINVHASGWNPISAPTPGLVTGTTWTYGSPPATRQLLTLSLKNISHLSVDLARARLRNGTLSVTSDGPVELVLTRLRPATRVLLDGRSIRRRPTRSTTLRLPTGTSIVLLTADRTPASRDDPPARTAEVVTPQGLATGIYTGTIHDPEGEPDSYTATIRISAHRLASDRLAGTVRYTAPGSTATFIPGLACRGTLDFLRRGGARYLFSERIAGGSAAQCISGGTVTLTRRTGRTLTYTWTKRGFTDPAPTGRLTWRR